MARRTFPKALINNRNRRAVRAAPPPGLEQPPSHRALDNAFDPQTAEIDVPLENTVAISGLEDDTPSPELDPEYGCITEQMSQHAIAGKRRRFVKERTLNTNYRNAVIEAMGEDRVVFEQALSYSDSPKIRNFLMGLATTKYKDWPLTRIASNFGVSASELTLLWRDYHLARGMLAVTKAIPRAMERIAQDAVAGETVCPHCDGRTTVIMQVQDVDDPDREPVREIVICPNCKGEGTIFKPGHEHSRDKMLEMVGLTKKGNNSNVQINQKFQFSGVESVIDELDRVKRNGNEQKAIDASFEQVDDNQDEVK